MNLIDLIFSFTERTTILEDRSLKIDNVTRSDNGEYICEADNGVSSVVSSGFLVVYGKILSPSIKYLISFKFSISSSSNRSTNIRNSTESSNW